MPSDYPLDPRSSAAQQVRTTLQARERTLRSEVAAATPARAASGRDAHEVLDRKDEAVEHMQTGIGDAEVERDVAELREIGEALQRLEAGRYGLCKDCDEAIDPRRLQAEPFAVRCAPCQAALERTRQLRG